MLAALLVATALGACTGWPPPPLELYDLAGEPLDPLSDIGTATVFLFTRSDCPISNRYAPEVRRLAERFGPRGVAFYLVYPDPDEPAAAIRRHLDLFGYALPALRDPRHTLVARTGARVTPEAAVFDAGGRLVYRGRIDDRYVAFGKARPEPTRRDLEAVLESLVAGERTELVTTRAIGCFIADLS